MAKLRTPTKALITVCGTVCRKNIFVSKRTLQMGVMDAVICFNEGAYAITEVLKALKINPGVNTCEGLRKIDYVRICETEMAVQKASKESRTTKGKLKESRMLYNGQCKMSTLLEIFRL
ncbi:hypothetical protein TNCV_3763161 [Trichonephila clavipes]|uniref:Uncharacterized protein n=1 Tax=Trichonephila clavipes TaxID=2585209 RepID=A0A8X6VVB3_TRICX|nr:hypothetical protein TNCV_3763161 [Trichonephila clavipes]